MITVNGTIKHKNEHLITMTMTNATHDNIDNLTNTKLSIITLHINGLAEDKQRKKLFENLIKKQT